MSVEYSMRISRLTVDKLGVKLYDRVSAVIAELIANAYDADARTVTVHAPMGQFLATRAEGKLQDKSLVIKVVDDGIGMTPQQMQDFFLVVGAERRDDPDRGDRSPCFNRKVMGRKGVGKLAPFGICKTIEVISSGGQLIDETGANSDSKTKGYLTSHIILDYEGIMALDNEPDERYKPPTGTRNESYSPTQGTTIILRNFNYRKVPAPDILARQISQRFGIKSEDWRIRLVDNTQSDAPAQEIDEFDIETMANTRLTFQPKKAVLNPDGTRATDLTAGFEYEGMFYPVTGWMAYSKAPYKDDLMAGVRIYCRGKIAAQTSIFNHRAGFTGEHSIRSYLIGEVHADWLDEDEDLIQTDRRDILWSDELAVAFQAWGQNVIKRIGTLSRDPMRQTTLQLFLEAGDVDARILSAYPTKHQQAIRDSAKQIAESFGRAISRGEVEDHGTIQDLVELSITLAPHVTLNDTMREAIASSDTTLSALSSLLRTARLAELSSFGRIAEDRLKIINRLEVLKDSPSSVESDIQQLLADAPWLINPEWAPVTENQTFSTLRREFEKYYQKKTSTPLLLTEFRKSGKRPDFVLASQEGTLQIIEIKRPGHALSNSEMDRIVTYYYNMEGFLNEPGNEKFLKHFEDFHITLVCDKLNLSDTQRAAYDGYRVGGKLTYLNWSTFLLKAEHIHRDFLKEANRQRDAECVVE